MKKTVKKYSRKPKKIHRKKRTQYRKKRYGGTVASLNYVYEPIDSAIPLNNYDTDIQHDTISSRTLPQIGGKKRKTRNNKKHKKRRSKKQRGGLLATDVITGTTTSTTNDVLSFGTTAGNEYILQKLAAEPISSGVDLSVKPHMVPLV